MLAGFTDAFKPLIMSFEGKATTSTSDEIKMKLLDSNCDERNSAFFNKNPKKKKSKLRNDKPIAMAIIAFNTSANRSETKGIHWRSKNRKCICCSTVSYRMMPGM